MRSSLRPLLALPLFLFALASCDSSTGPDDRTSTPAHLDVVSGDLQSAEVGTELGAPLMVRVTDAKGKPVKGAIVNFRVLAGGGSVYAGAALTNDDGMAQERWTLGTAARDTQRVEARAVDPSTGQGQLFGVFRAVGTAGAPANVTPVGSAARSGFTGIGEALQVRVSDRYGNPVPGTPVVWTVRAGGGSITPSTSNTDSAGVAGAMWQLGPPGNDAQMVEAAASVSLKTAFTATAALPLGTSLVKRGGDAQTGTVGAALAQPLKVAVLLPNGQPAPGVTVTWSTGAGSGSVSPLVSVTDAAGEATTTWTVGTVAGAQTASAAVAGVGPVTFTATAAAGPPAALVAHGGEGQTALAGATLSAPLVVAVLDAYGNPVAGQPVTWTVTGGGGSVSPAATTTDANGEARTTWTLGSAGPQSARAASGSLATVTYTATATAPPPPPPSIAVTIAVPKANTVVADSFFLIAQGSSAQVVSATATVEGGETFPLRVTSGPEFSGYIKMPAGAPGPREVVVRAAAANGDSAFARITVILDRPPRVTVTSPVEGLVARPTMQVDADCVDDDPNGCASLTVTAGGSTVASGTSGIHSTVSLAALEGNAVTVGITGRDSRGQTAQLAYNVFVESSPRLTEVAAAPEGRLWDYDAGRLLYVAAVAAAESEVRLRSRSSGSEVLLRRARDGSAFSWYRVRGYLHPAGAIFSQADAVWDWRDGALLQKPGGYGLLVSEGDWALWQLLYRENLVTGATDVVSDGAAGNIGYDVAPNGDVVYWSGYQIYRYRNGTTTRITSDDTSVRWNLYPVTDGTNIVYAKRVPCCVSNEHSNITLFDGTTEILLSADWQAISDSRHFYEVNNGWVAYLLRDGTGTAQVWVRSPDAVTRQVTFTSGNKAVEALGPNGEVVFSNGGRMYVIVAPYTGAPVDVGSAAYGLDNTHVVFRGNELVTFLGRSAFHVSY